MGHQWGIMDSQALEDEQRSYGVGYSYGNRTRVIKVGTGQSPLLKVNGSRERKRMKAPLTPKPIPHVRKLCLIHASNCYENVAVVRTGLEWKTEDEINLLVTIFSSSFHPSS